MTVWQKTVKYIAMAFAVLLAFGIVVGIGKGIALLVKGGGVLDNMQTHTIAASEQINCLDIEISAAEITIKEGDNFSVESNLKYLTVKTKGDTLILSEMSKRFPSGSKKTPKLTLILPKDKAFNDVELFTGAGTFTLDTLTAKHLSFEFGAGEVTIEQLTATESIEMEGGAGKITIKSGSLKNLDFDMGVGEVNMTSALLGSSTFNCGVGEANITLLGTENEYTVNVEKGIGAASINGQSIKNDTDYGTGENRVEVDGGVGAVNITFKVEELQ